MTDLHLTANAADIEATTSALAYVGAPAGPAGLAVLEVSTLRVVADGARPSRLVEIVIDDDIASRSTPSVAPGAIADRLGIVASPDGGAHIELSQAAMLGRLAVAVDERSRPDHLAATDWAIDVVVLADGLGLSEMAISEAEVAAAVLLNARDRLTADAIDAASIVARYATRPTADELTGLVAATAGDATTIARADGPALARRDGERRQRVTGAVAVHPHDLPAGIALDRRARLVWQPTDGHLHIEVDVVGRADDVWLRIGDVDGVIIAIALLSVDALAEHADPLRPRTAVAELSFGGHNDLTAIVVEITGDATLPMSSTRSRATAEAIADGRDGASAARSGRWPAARDAWLRCARAWARADDIDRQALALAEASIAFEHLGDDSEATATRRRAAAMTTRWADVETRDRLGTERAFVADGLGH